MPLEFTILSVVLTLLLIICTTTLLYSIKVFKMHDVRNEDGDYKWMGNDDATKINSNIIDTQKLMLEGLNALTRHNKQISKLLETQTNVTLVMFEELKKVKSGEA